MKLYSLVPTDSRYNEWLFWYQDEDAYVRPRQFYADLVCGACGKLDEVAAINRGIDSSVTIKSKRDFIEMSDGLISVSTRASAGARAGDQGIMKGGVDDSAKQSIREVASQYRRRRAEGGVRE